MPHRLRTLCDCMARSERGSGYAYSRRASQPLMNWRPCSLMVRNMRPPVEERRPSGSGGRGRTARTARCGRVAGSEGEVPPCLPFGKVGDAKTKTPGPKRIGRDEESWLG